MEIERKRIVMKATLLVASLFLLAVFLSAEVNALGLFYGRKVAVIEEGSSACYNSYSVFNEQEADVYVDVVVSEELQEFFLSSDATNKRVPALTEPSTAVPVEVCFKVPDNVYSSASDCVNNPVEKTGRVTAVQKSGETGGGTGSSATIAVSAPLTVRVGCAEEPAPEMPQQQAGNSYSWLYLLVIIILLVLIILLLVKRRQTNEPMRYSRR